MNFAYLLYVVNNRRYNCFMRPAIMIILLSLLNITLNSAQENEKYPESGWISETESRANLMISEIIEKSDFTEKIDIIKILGRRKDRDFNIILENIYYGKYGKESEKETVIFYCISSLIKSEKDFEINNFILKTIFRDIDRFSDSVLRKEIIKKTDYAGRKTAVEILAEEGKRLAEISRKNGILSAVNAEECRLFFRYAEKYNEPVLDQLADIIYRNAVNFH